MSKSWIIGSYALSGSKTKSWAAQKQQLNRRIEQFQVGRRFGAHRRITISVSLDRPLQRDNS